MRYLDHLRPWMDGEGRLNDFLRIRDGRLILADQVDLLALTHQHGAPLEVSFCPLIARRVQAMHQYFADAIGRSGYRGAFLYAYATKANFAEEVVRTAVRAGAHYETSSAFDVRIAQQLWRAGVLPPDRFVFCNGSKEPPYIDAILNLRRAGCPNVVPILDDPHEFEALASCPEPLLLGVRERKNPGDLATGATYGYDRFGMLPEEMVALAARIAETHHKLILYHAMVGSQLEDSAFFAHEIMESLDGYARLRRHTPALAYFDFGGGMPTGAYHLTFAFDYAQFVEQLLRDIGAWCADRDIPHPQLVGEFGRYTCADHGVHIFQVSRIKRGHPGQPLWYLLDGSLMVALPDILIVDNQAFIVLPLNHLEAESATVVLGGRRTCDSDDFYPRAGNPPLTLPLVGTNAEPFDYAQGRRPTANDQSGSVAAGPTVDSAQMALSSVCGPGSDAAPLLIAFFGTGAYQAMLSGEGGAHHCLAPEAPKVIFEAREGALTTRVVGEQSWESVLADLGYR